MAGLQSTLDFTGLRAPVWLDGPHGTKFAEINSERLLVGLGMSRPVLAGQGALFSHSKPLAKNWNSHADSLSYSIGDECVGNSVSNAGPH